MYPPEWSIRLTQLAAQELPVEGVLAATKREFNAFGDDELRTAIALRNTFNLSTAQLHYVIEWLEGVIDDAELTKRVPRLDKA